MTSLLRTPWILVGVSRKLRFAVVGIVPPLYSSRGFKLRIRTLHLNVSRQSRMTSSSLTMKFQNASGLFVVFYVAGFTARCKVFLWKALPSWEQNLKDSHNPRSFFNHQCESSVPQEQFWHFRSKRVRLKLLMSAPNLKLSKRHPVHLHIWASTVTKPR